MKYQRMRKSIVITSAVLFHSLLIIHMLFSPVIIVMASWKGIINASFISFIIMLILSLFFGRAFCAWFCPGCGVQEVVGLFVKKKLKDSKAKYIKYIIFFIWISMIMIGYILRGFTKIDLTYGMSNVSIAKRIVMSIGVTAIMLPLAILYGKFASCKFICWQAPLMILGTRIRDKLHLPGLRIVTNVDSCKNCGACSKLCPMGIDVAGKITQGEIIDNECILCGRCIETCRFGALKYSISVHTYKRNNSNT